MIYTSYFAMLKNLPNNIIPISIAGKAPTWYKGLQYKKLAPKYDFFIQWKQNHDNEYYIKCYNEQVLAHLDPRSVYIDLWHMCDYTMQMEPDICLICYEKPSEFCHRHLVANWLREHGAECQEWSG